MLLLACQTLIASKSVYKYMRLHLGHSKVKCSIPQVLEQPTDIKPVLAARKLPAVNAQPAYQVIQRWPQIFVLQLTGERSHAGTPGIEAPAGF